MAGKPATEGRTVEWVVRHVMHEVATGRWQSGDRVPSVRRAEELWGAHRLTVLKAYRRLVEQNILRGAGTAGFVVAAGPQLGRLARHQDELRTLYRPIERLIRRASALSPLSALRGLVQLAEAEARARPECAFAECTMFEARAHADEVERRLGTPCLAVDTHHLQDQLAPGIRTVVTTPFHRAEVAAVARRRKLAFVELPIEMAPSFVAQLDAARERVFLGIDRAVIEHVVSDLQRELAPRADRMVFEQVAPADLDAALERHVGRQPGRQLGRRAPARRLVALSPTLWEARPERWRDHPAVVPVLPRVRERAWPILADALGVPWPS